MCKTHALKRSRVCCYHADRTLGDDMKEWNLKQAGQENGNIDTGTDFLLKKCHEATGTGDRLDAISLERLCGLDERACKFRIPLI